MKKILLVEDSKTSGMVFKKKIEMGTQHKVDWVESMASAIELLNENHNTYFAAVLDFNLPDSTNGEIIDEVTGRDIPSIVFTGLVDEKIRDLVWSKKVVDYVPKGKPKSIEEVVSLINRLEKNEHTTILVVDGSKMARKTLTNLLYIHRYKTIEAENAVEALKIIGENPKIKMTMINATMEGMDGFELTEEIRKTRSKDELGIMGISSRGKDIYGAKFIKAGANDFFVKQTFLTEEFYCRIHQCIEAIENIQKVKEAAIRDYLTGLHNRRYFFDAGKKLLANSVRTNSTICCSMIDIDFFKKINDTYGHDIGDLVLQDVATTLKTNFRDTDIVSRFGGEEFCVLTVNIDKDNALRVFETIRDHFDSTEIELPNGKKVKVTISIGVFPQAGKHLDDMVKEADLRLYKAKETGRNKVVMQ